MLAPRRPHMHRISELITCLRNFASEGAKVICNLLADRSVIVFIGLCGVTRILVRGLVGIPVLLGRIVYVGSEK